MRPHEYVGQTLIETTAISAIVGSGADARVYHGLRPETTRVPSINFYELGGGMRNMGMERQPFSVNCRAETAKAARELARLVVTVFAGESGTGTYGTASGFSVARTALTNDGGVIPEPEDRVYNAPVDIHLVFGPGEVT